MINYSFAPKNLFKNPPPQSKKISQGNFKPLKLPVTSRKKSSMHLFFIKLQKLHFVPLLVQKLQNKIFP